jgi:putative MATE family efflux protein
LEIHPTSDAPVPSQPEGFWQSIRAALRGSHQDFTEGSFGRAIALLAIPMVLEMSMESLFALVDVFFVSRLGAAAVASVGLTESMLSIVYTMSMGLGMAATATVARRIGEKNPREASHAAAQALWLGVAFSIAIGVAGVVLAPKLLRLMGADDEVLRVGTSFTRLTLGGCMSVLLLFILNGVFRGAGDAATAMRSLMLANVINVVLNPCLIFGLGPFPEMGLLGSATATVIGRGVGVLYQLNILFRGGARVRLERGVGGPDLRGMGRMLRMALGGIGQMLVSTVSWIALVRIISQFGAAALAGYTVALRIVIVALLPAWGLSNAAATLVGQNLGAGKPDRAEKSVWKTGLYNVQFLGAVAVVFILGAERIVAPFIQDPLAAGYAVDCLRYLSFGYVFYAYGMVMLQSFNGAGDTFTPTVINLCCFWLFQLPLAYVLAIPLGRGPAGVFIAITVAQSLSAVVAVLVFRRGKWKLRKV